MVIERVSNGDLSFYIDSPNKEFIIKYAQNTMRFNAKEKTFSELNALIFANKNRLTGISDTVKNESTVALATPLKMNQQLLYLQNGVMSMRRI